MDVRFYRDALRQHGVGATLYHAAFRAVNHVAEVAVLDALRATPAMVDRRSFCDARRGEARLLDAAALRPYAADATNALTGGFIDEAARKGDRCCALFEDGALVSYGWYSTRPTRLLETAGSPVLHFDPSYVYLYHAFTRPSHRGRRLHAIGMAAALDAYAKEGHEGLVSYVDSSNLASLKSFHRMGFVAFGHLVLVKTGARYHFCATPGCKKHGLRVEAT
jgi:hypothetical protein